MAQARSTRPSHRGTIARTALILAVVAFISFGGFVLAQYSGSPTLSMGVLGLVLVGFLLAALTRVDR
jgi:hypothetical protein